MHKFINKIEHAQPGSSEIDKSNSTSRTKGVPNPVGVPNIAEVPDVLRT